MVYHSTSHRIYIPERREPYGKEMFSNYVETPVKTVGMYAITGVLPNNVLSRPTVDVKSKLVVQRHEDSVFNSSRPIEQLLGSECRNVNR